MFPNGTKKKKTTAKTTNKLKLAQVGTVLGHLTLFAAVRRVCKCICVSVYLCIFAVYLSVFALAVCAVYQWH